MCLLACGCANVELNRNVKDTTTTYHTLVEAQVEANLENFKDNPYAMPFYINFAQGVVTTQDVLGMNASFPLTPSTLQETEVLAAATNTKATTGSGRTTSTNNTTTRTSGGSTTTSGSATNGGSSTTGSETDNNGATTTTKRTKPTVYPSFGGSVSAQRTQTWNDNPINDPDALRRLRALFRYAVGYDVPLEFKVGDFLDRLLPKLESHDLTKRQSDHFKEQALEAMNKVLGDDLRSPVRPEDFDDKTAMQSLLLPAMEQKYAGKGDQLIEFLQDVQASKQDVYVSKMETKNKPILSDDNPLKQYPVPYSDKCRFMEEYPLQTVSSGGVTIIFPDECQKTARVTQYKNISPVFLSSHGCVLCKNLKMTEEQQAVTAARNAQRDLVHIVVAEVRR